MKRIDSAYNYIGLQFINALWEEVAACCILPPDATFRDSGPEWEEGRPVPPAEDEDGDRITILWRKDEPEDQLPQRPKLHAILAYYQSLSGRVRCLPPSAWVPEPLRLMPGLRRRFPVIPGESA